jgi:hypothetical protein
MSKSKFNLGDKVRIKEIVERKYTPAVDKIVLSLSKEEILTISDVMKFSGSSDWYFVEENDCVFDESWLEKAE